jgi:soluble lytic murein transglycosylase-like protein
VIGHSPRGGAPARQGHHRAIRRSRIARVARLAAAAAVAIVLAMSVGAAGGAPPEGAVPGQSSGVPTAAAAVSPEPAAAANGVSGTASGWLRLPDSLRARYAHDIRDMSNRYGVSTSLVEAVIRVESAFDHLAVSPKGARGLMQLMPQTAQSLGVLDSFNPRQNIEGGVRYLRRLLDRYPGELKLALAAYNAGEGAVDAHRGIPPYPETQQYVKKVLAQSGAAAMSAQEPAPAEPASAPAAPRTPGTAIAPGPPPKRLVAGSDQPLPALPMIDEARRASHAGSTSGTLSMRLPSRLSQESMADTLARMKQQGRLSP